MSLNSSLYKKFFLNMLLTIRGIVRLWGTFPQVMTIDLFWWHQLVEDMVWVMQYGIEQVGFKSINKAGEVSRELVTTRFKAASSRSRRLSKFVQAYILTNQNLSRTYRQQRTQRRSRGRSPPVRLSVAQHFHRSMPKLHTVRYRSIKYYATGAAKMWPAPRETYCWSRRCIANRSKPIRLILLMRWQGFKETIYMSNRFQFSFMTTLKIPHRQQVRALSRAPCMTTSRIATRRVSRAAATH